MDRHGAVECRHVAVLVVDSVERPCGAGVIAVAASLLGLKDQAHTLFLQSKAEDLHKEVDLAITEVAPVV